MPQISLVGGAYSARSVIANAQRCVNLFPEKNTADAPAPTTHYQTPGLTLLSTPAQQGYGRGAYTATNGELFVVIGSKVYYVDPDFILTELGTIAPGLNPVSMKDNGIVILLVDGTANGYTINLTTHAFAQIVSPYFYGGDRVDFIDTFFVLNRPNTNQWYASDSNAVTFTGTYIAAKASTPDKIATIVCTHREIWVIGATKGSEVWYNAGAASFPFQIVPGVLIPYGCAAKYSVAVNGLEIFWLGIDENGSFFILQAAPYAAKVISTPALQYEFSSYTTISDAVGLIYQQDGHIFYQLSFPTQDKTWVYDLTTQQWHERSYLDANGREHRHRANCHAFAYGRNVVLDWQTGLIYQFDTKNFTDNGAPIIRRRGFPHLVKDGNRVMYANFTADVEVGTAAGTQGVHWGDFNADFNADFGPSPGIDNIDDPWISLRWSDDRGKTFLNPLRQSLGAEGEYLTTVSWSRLGMARDRVFELFWTGNYQVSLNGAYIVAKAARS